MAKRGKNGRDKGRNTPSKEEIRAEKNRACKRRGPGDAGGSAYSLKSPEVDGDAIKEYLRLLNSKKPIPASVSDKLGTPERTVIVALLAPSPERFAVKVSLTDMLRVYDNGLLHLDIK